MKKAILSAALITLLPASVFAQEKYDQKYEPAQNHYQAPAPQHKHVVPPHAHADTNTTTSFLTSDLYGAYIPPFVHVSPGSYIPPTYTVVTIPRLNHTTFTPIINDNSDAIQSLGGVVVPQEIYVAPPPMILHQEHHAYQHLGTNLVPYQPGEAVIISPIR